MSKDKNWVKEITPIDTDFSKWYTDVVKKAELLEYSNIRGCMIIRPYGYSIWENIKSQLDCRLKQTGHQNVYMPMFIPESLLQKEKDHVEGFSPEVAWITHGGDDKLSERLCVRPTSEVLFCDHYSNIIESYRDLPKLYNQWCSVVRWEKSTRPFLRSMEFLWQEGHTAHETADEAKQETLNIINLYADFFKDVLAIPVLKGLKTETEKFAGAKFTYTIESVMHNGVALQSGTSHYFSNKFAKAFNINFTNRDNKLNYVYQTSWGVSSRIIGAVIMTHGDDRGLILPPKIAPIQVVIVPISMNKGNVKEVSKQIYDDLKNSFNTHIDLSDNSPGWKFNQYEMKGIPIRLEIGPRDIENSQCVLVRRDTGIKLVVDLKDLYKSIDSLLIDIHNNLYSMALKNLNDKISYISNLENMIKVTLNQNKIIKAPWCGNAECEDKIKEKTGLSSRCIPFNSELDEKNTDNCICCSKNKKFILYFGKSY